MSIDTGMRKQNVVPPYPGILFSLEKEHSPTEATTWLSLEIVTTNFT